MGKSQKGELLGFLPSFACPLPCKPTKFDATCLFRRQFQSKSLEPIFQLFTKRLCVGLILKAGQKIIRKTKVIRLAPAPLFEPSVKPQVQRVVQIDVCQEPLGYIPMLAWLLQCRCLTRYCLRPREDGLVLVVNAPPMLPAPIVKGSAPSKILFSRG